MINDTGHQKSDSNEATISKPFQNLKINPNVLLSFILAILVLIFSYLFFSESQKDDLKVEAVKFMLIGIVGGLTLQWYNGIRDRNIALNEFRKSFLINLTREYNKIKKSQRVLKRSIKNEENPNPVYENEIIEIINAQLELEFLHRQLTTLLFSCKDIPTPGKDNKLKKYLRKLGIDRDWVDNANIEKIDERTIEVSYKDKSISLQFDKENRGYFETHGGSIPYQFFIKYIIKINKIVLIREDDKILKVTPYIFPNKSIKILKLIRQMEDNLNKKVIKEKCKTGLDWLIADSFHSEFVEPFHECVESIQDEILTI